MSTHYKISENRCKYCGRKSKQSHIVTIQHPYCSECHEQRLEAANKHFYGDGKKEPKIVGNYFTR